MSTNVDLRELAIDRGGTDASSITTRRHIFTRYVLPIVLLVGFVSLVLWTSRDLVFPPTPVTVVPVFATNVEVREEGTPLFKAAGWIEPRPTPIRVAAMAPGVVEALHVVEDQSVNAGDPIAELVKDDAQLAHQRALADLELREAALDEANAALAAAESQYDQPVHLQAALGEAEAMLAKIDTSLANLPFEIRRAEAEFEALQADYEGKLASQGVVAGVEIDIAKGKADAAQALLEELTSRTESLEREQQALIQRRDALQTQLRLLSDETKAKDEARAQVRAALARVQQAHLAVAEAQLQLDRMTIVAPVDGRVFRLIAHPGARIGSGMTQMTGHDGSTVVTMYQPSKLQVRVDVRFEDLPQVSLHQPVEINNPALAAPLTGRVLFISSEADIQKNTLQVKVEIPDPPAVFKPEMLVDVTFLSPRQPDRTAEPTEAVRLYISQKLIQQDDDGPFVWIADRSKGVARKREIETGAAGSNGLVEVTDGLTVSSRIIASNLDHLRDGERIRVTEEDNSFGTGNDADSSDDSRISNRLQEVNQQ